jgi:hypothetical protein
LGYKREVIGAEREIVTETPCHALRVSRLAEVLYRRMDKRH